MIRIVHLIPNLALGGAERTLQNLILSNRRHDIEHIVVTLIGGGIIAEKLRERNIRVFEFVLSKNIKSGKSLYRLLRTIGTLDPDFLFGWMYHANIFALIAHKLIRGRTKLIWNIRHSIYRFSDEKHTTALMIKLGSLLSRFPDLIVYNSNTSATLHEKIGYAKGASVVIHNGIDCDDFRPDSNARIRLLERIQKPEDTRLVGIVGRYHPAKDYRTFVSAAAMLMKMQSRVHFVMIGRGLEKTNSDLMGSLQELGVCDHFSLLGEIENVKRLMPGFDVCVSSSVSEAFPNVVAESMACGVPCVVTDVGDSSNIVGDIGFTVPARNPSALAQAINELLSLSNTEVERLSKAARNRILELFSSSEMISRFNACLASE